MNGSFYRTHGKRAFDIVAAGILLTILSPLLMLIVVAIVCSSRGAPIIVQPRVGFDGKLFRFWKFRSMYAEERMPQIAATALTLAAEGVLLKIDNDPRLTKIGRILRTYSLDELPQLVNILKGEMSFVGPRPLLPFMVEPYPIESGVRSAVRPGLTGLWQIKARSESNSVLQMIEYDARYVKEFSFLADLRILAATVPQVLKGTGAK